MKYIKQEHNQMHEKDGNTHAHTHTHIRTSQFGIKLQILETTRL